MLKRHGYVPIIPTAAGNDVGKLVIFGERKTFTDVSVMRHLRNAAIEHIVNQGGEGKIVVTASPHGCTVDCSHYGGPHISSLKRKRFKRVIPAIQKRLSKTRAFYQIEIVVSQR